ncbi:MAG: hypothetical protein QOF83_2084 [Solirubrobacteraceae bacterium]|nr:hypothetical protein [Solirubrobacteraceae bacterium]
MRGVDWRLVTRGDLERWRQHVLLDDSLQAQLRECPEWEPFRARCLQLAAHHGHAVAAGDLDRARGAAARAGAPGPGPERQVLEPVAPSGWTPIAFNARGPSVRWADLRGLQFGSEPFSDTARRALTQPYRRLWQVDTSPAALADRTGECAPPPVTGLIFHTSRCGSTLVCRLLAQLAATVVLVEPPIIDEILRAEATQGQRRRFLGWALSALARPHTPGHHRVIIKLDAWSTRDLPVIRGVLPETPWVFLYRDPAAVVASQLRLPGMPGAPGVLAPELFGLDLPTALAMPREEYCARVVGTVCEDALAHLGNGGLPVNYDRLPQAVMDEILPHFQIPARCADKARMGEIADLDAKRPYQRFDRAALAVTPTVRAASDRWAGAAFARLEQAQAGQTPEAPAAW